MKITILAIGKKHDPKLEAAISNYSQRLARYVKFEWKLVEAKITPSMSAGEIKNTESTVLIQAIDSEDTVIMLDERGKQLSSPELASKLQNYMNQSTKNITFVIGGAFGVNQELADRSNFILSLSELVFPHQLVRLILIEQLYRSHTILSGEKYHHQ